jgi:hypothetical protein
MLLKNKNALAKWIEDRLGFEGNPEIAARMAEYLSDDLWNEIGYRTPKISQFEAALASAIEESAIEE